MTVAALTFTYNEIVNLPIWIKHYGSNFGEENLFVADRGSNDGSIKNIGNANLIRLPRNEFDEHEKTNFLNHFHSSLLNFYDVVICTDCDEMIVPDPDKYTSLRSYADKMTNDTVRGIGIDVVHLITTEPPIDLNATILSQRHLGKFSAPECKNLISKVPITWLPGLHSCDKKPIFDRDLYIFHLKLMDYGVAMNRQKINSETVWSKRSVQQKFGAHHRYDQKTFVHRAFLVPIDILNRQLVGEFEFGKELARIETETLEKDGYYHVPMDIHKFAWIPERFAHTI